MASPRDVNLSSVCVYMEGGGVIGPGAVRGNNRLGAAFGGNIHVIRHPPPDSQEHVPFDISDHLQDAFSPVERKINR